MGKIKKIKKPDDHIDTTMSLGDHLEELRARLILAILGLLTGSVVCLFFGGTIIRFIEGPYNIAIREHVTNSEQKIAKTDSVDFVGAVLSNIRQALDSDPNAPAVDPNVINFVNKVYAQTLEEWTSDANSTSPGVDDMSSTQRLIVLAPADPFVGFMKISLISGLIISSPWVFYQLWMFVAVGLYEKERRYIQVAVPFSALLFVTGALFFLFLIAPLSLKFFLMFGDLIGVSSNWTFQKYISFVTMLMLVFGLGFQTPIAIFVLNRTGLVSIKALKSSRKYVFIGVFAVAAIATPPDVISQITLALPLYVLFELGILMSWFAERKKLREAAI